MEKPRIFPWANQVERRTFFLFIMILDVLTQGLGGIICGMIGGLIIFLKNKNFNSKYFNLFSFGRTFIDIVILLLVIYYFLTYSLGDKTIFVYFTIENALSGYFIFSVLFLYYSWNIYLSYNFFLQIPIYQEEFKKLSHKEKIFDLNEQNK